LHLLGVEPRQNKRFNSAIRSTSRIMLHGRPKKRMDPRCQQLKRVQKHKPSQTAQTERNVRPVSIFSSFQPSIKRRNPAETAYRSGHPKGTLFRAVRSSFQVYPPTPRYPHTHVTGSVSGGRANNITSLAQEKRSTVGLTRSRFDVRVGQPKCRKQRTVAVLFADR